MANHKLLSLLCLLIAVVAVTTVKVVAAAAHRRLAQPTSIPAAAFGCWKSIMSSESCVRDMAKSVASLRVRVSRECCSVLEKIGDKCVDDVFSTFTFGSFHSLVELGCDLAS